ncbi:hypothetical protein [Bosea sp. (in: a-proteobacteria)]|jgi:hypothetical protein|uniref:hypothetical protein n=1 Tax=Bosea sp. (in: a-proteobacteria) TaxID=1871050 RepID=UPI003F716620
MLRIGRAVVLAAFLAVSASAQAQERREGWNSGYQMGTSYAGVASNGGARVTFYCGDARAAAANPAIRRGPSLEISLSKVSKPRAAAANLRFVVDGKATAIPVTAESVPDAVNFHWKPPARFDETRMARLLAGLHKAATLSVKVYGAQRDIPLTGVADALSDELLRCD